MEIEPDHMVMSRRNKGQEDNIYHSCMAMSWRRDARESSKIKSFLFHSVQLSFGIYTILIYFLEWRLIGGASLALAFISEALEVVNTILLSV